MKGTYENNQGIKIHHQLQTNTTKYTKKRRYELVEKPTKQPYRNFLRIDLAKKNNNNGL